MCVSVCGVRTGYQGPESLNTPYLLSPQMANLRVCIKPHIFYLIVSRMYCRYYIFIWGKV